jgi:hypothetical protein
VQSSAHGESFSNVYPLDFDAVTTPGTYTHQRDWPGVRHFAEFSDRCRRERLRTPLANSLYFYENERDGANFVATPLRTAGAHLNDSAANVYLTPT